jgi:hypothetical protein
VSRSGRIRIRIRGDKHPEPHLETDLETDLDPDTDPYPFHDHFLDLDREKDPETDLELDPEKDPEKDPETDWELEPDSWQSALQIVYYTGGHTGAPYLVNKIFILDLLSLGAFCLFTSLYF